MRLNCGNFFLSLYIILPASFFVSKKNWPTDVAISESGGIAAITDGCELIIFDVSDDEQSIQLLDYGVVIQIMDRLDTRSIFGKSSRL